VFFVYCVPSFHCWNLAVPLLSMLNCLNTVVNWLLQWKNFVTLYVCCCSYKNNKFQFKKKYILKQCKESVRLRLCPFILVFPLDTVYRHSTALLCAVWCLAEHVIVALSTCVWEDQNGRWLINRRRASPMLTALQRQYRKRLSVC